MCPGRADNVRGHILVSTMVGKRCKLASRAALTLVLFAISEQLSHNEFDYMRFTGLHRMHVTGASVVSSLRIPVITICMITYVVICARWLHAHASVILKCNGKGLVLAGTS